MQESVYKTVKTKSAKQQADIDSFNRKSKVRVYKMVNGKITEVIEAPANEMKQIEQAELEKQYDE